MTNGHLAQELVAIEAKDDVIGDFITDHQHSANDPTKNFTIPNSDRNYDANRNYETVISSKYSRKDEVEKEIGETIVGSE